MNPLSLTFPPRIKWQCLEQQHPEEGHARATADFIGVCPFWKSYGQRLGRIEMISC